eukprot:scaffold18425_cov51-Phaeocystis_antarctica.AAC.3
MVICAAGLSPVRGLPHHKRSHYHLLTPSHSCAAGSLASARGPRTARTPQARLLLCSSTGQRCCFAHAGVLARCTHKACSHGALIHGVRTTQRLAVAAAATSSSLLRPRLVPTRSSRFPRCRGRWATARASTARSEVNYFPSISGKLVELDAFGAPSSPRTRSAAHSAPIPRTPSSPMLPTRYRDR